MSIVCSVDAICIADPAFDAPPVSGMPRPAHAAPVVSAAPTPHTMPAHGHPAALAPTAPTVRIVEQPASKALRYTTTLCLEKDSRIIKVTLSISRYIFKSLLRLV